MNGFSGRPVRVGLVGASVGAGWSNVAHLPALTALPCCDLVAVATRNPSSAAAAAKAYGARLAFGDPAELIDSPEVELVAVCVRAPAHFELVDRAIAAGKHVYCEWPLGSDSSQTKMLAERAKTRGVAAMVGLQAHGSPVLKRVRALIAEGYVGEVFSTSFTGSEPDGWGAETPQFYAYGCDRDQGATLLTLMTGHALDALCHCLGEITSLSALVANRRTATRIIETGKTIALTAPDQVAVMGRLAGGAVATLHMRAGSPTHEEMRWEINGSKGYLLMTDMMGVQVGQPRLFGSTGGGPMVELDPAPNDPDVPEAVPGGPPLNLAHQYAALARAIRGGGGVVPDFDHALRRRLLLDSIQQASDSGRQISFA